MGSKKPSGRAVASKPSAKPNKSRGWLSLTSARPADGVTETAEDRARHIADEIRNCSKEMGIPPSDLSWFDFREYATVQWGMNSVNIVRRDITRLGGFAAIRDAYFPREDTDQAVTNKRIREHALLSRRLGAHLADEAFQYKQIEAFSEKVFSGRVKPVGFARKKAPQKGVFKREIVVMISDTHFGSDIRATATGAEDFGRVQEARYMAQLVQQVVTYKEEYRDETALRVVILGDLIHGCLHDLRDGAIIAEQVDRAIHLLVQAVGHFAARFPKVTVECVTGNHGRDKTRHPKRATTDKFDSRETLVYASVRRACSALKNVEWHIPLAAFGVFELFGRKVFYTHGDTHIRVGNPGSSINVLDLERQVNRLNATLRDRDEYVLVLVGHAHQFVHLALNNGVSVIVNGPFTALDEYATSIGIFESVSSQTMFEATPGFPVGDVRRIVFDKKVAEDASLDKIIQPWKGFDQ
jgi:predicted phosphodiesterase